MAASREPSTSAGVPATSEGGDIFDALHDIEQQIMDRGFDIGEEQGREAGLAEGWELGIRKGSELGSELGTLAGTVQAWNASGLLSTERHQKLAADVEAAVASFPFDNPRDEQLLVSVLRARAKFKLLRSLLSKAGHVPPQSASKAELSF